MSYGRQYLESPFSTYLQSYEDDFDDRFDDDDERENDDFQDDSDEDTEEASETDVGRHEEPLEIKEQMYQDKLASLKKQMQQLRDGTHSEYCRKVKKLKSQYNERIRLNNLYREYMIECVERDYKLETKAAAKEFDEKKVDLKENLISELEDKRRNIESERFSMELTGDSMEVKPVMTRKLRRRPNDPIPVPEKRRKPPTAQIVYQLDEKEVENDLKDINRGKVLTPVRKPGKDKFVKVCFFISRYLSGTVGLHSPIAMSPNMNEMPLVETRIEDGKLLYERRWFHRGQSVYVEGRDMPKFAANISAIASDAVSTLFFIMWIR